MAECPAPNPQPKAGSPRVSVVKRTPLKTPEKAREVNQTVGATAPHVAAEGTPAEGKYQMGPYNSNDDGEGDPMVNAPVPPFLIPVTITAPQLDQEGRYKALIDSGCTWCLIS